MTDYEWRTFGKVKGKDIEKILRLEKFDEREVTDRYVLAFGAPAVNMKISSDGIKIKELIKTLKGVEQWGTYFMNYPVALVKFKDICSRTGFPQIPVLRNIACEDDILQHVSTEPNTDLMLVSVFKRRLMHLYRRDSMRVGVEVNYIKLFGNDYVSIAVEGKSQSDVETVVRELELKYPQMNYVEFLRTETIKKYKHMIFKSCGGKNG